jgi:hypothetical protein
MSSGASSLTTSTMLAVSTSSQITTNQRGILSQAAIIAGKALGTKPAPGQVKSIHLAAVAQKKEQEVIDRKIQRKDQADQRKAIVLAKKAEEEKVRIEQEKITKAAELEKKKVQKAEHEKRRKERDEKMAKAARDKAIREEKEATAIARIKVGCYCYKRLRLASGGFASS